MEPTPREYLLSLISEEKERYGVYSQLCAFYQVPPDPMILAKHQTKVETLRNLLSEKIITKLRSYQ